MSSIPPVSTTPGRPPEATSTPQGQASALNEQRNETVQGEAKVDGQDAFETYLDKADTQTAARVEKNQRFDVADSIAQGSPYSASFGVLLT